MSNCLVTVFPNLCQPWVIGKSYFDRSGEEFDRILLHHEGLQRAVDVHVFASDIQIIDVCRQIGFHATIRIPNHI